MDTTIYSLMTRWKIAKNTDFLSLNLKKKLKSVKCIICASNHTNKKRRRDQLNFVIIIKCWCEEKKTNGDDCSSEWQREREGCNKEMIIAYYYCCYCCQQSDNDNGLNTFTYPQNISVSMMMRLKFLKSDISNKCTDSFRQSLKHRLVEMVGGSRWATTENNEEITINDNGSGGCS